jgi:DNA topoisomerase-1
MRSLLIVESPNKAKTIRQILGSEYEVLATVGHFRDLPPKELGVAVEHQFEPTYVVHPDKKEVVNKLQAVKSRFFLDKEYTARYIYYTFYYYLRNLIK